MQLSRYLELCILLVTVPALSEVIPRCSMKHCPACNFTFPDFHLVCDFDGTELVPDPERLALIRVPATRSSVRRFIASPKMLTALAILGLFLAAAFVAYQQMTSRSARTLLAANVATPAAETPSTLTTRERSTPSHSISASAPATKQSMRPRRSSSVIVRNRHEKRNDKGPRNGEVARRRAQPASEKQPKVLAMLKTTWRVLKKPFNF
jgi:hypothetical protein